MMNYELINRRIRDRLDELGESSFDVSKAIGKNRNFLNDLMTGKKKSFSADMLPDIARALRCDANYLLGMDSQPLHPVAGTGIPVAGSIEPGVWRKPSRDPSVGKMVPANADPRFPAEDQQLWLVRSDTLNGLDVRDGSAILTARIGEQGKWFNLLVDGDLVVAERQRDGDILRTLLRVKRAPIGIVLLADGGDIEPVEWKSADAPLDPLRLTGVVLQIMRYRV